MTYAGHSSRATKARRRRQLYRRGCRHADVRVRGTVPGVRPGAVRGLRPESLGVLMHWKIVPGSMKRLGPAKLYLCIRFWETEANADALGPYMSEIDALTDVVRDDWGYNTIRPNATLRRNEYFTTARQWKLRPRTLTEKLSPDVDKFLQPDDVIEHILYTPAEVDVLRNKHIREMIERKIRDDADELRNPVKRRNLDPRYRNAPEVGTVPQAIRDMPQKGNHG